MSAEPYSIAAAARALRAGETASVALIESAIARADRYDGELGVYLARFDEAARRQARRADEERASGIDHGVLHGIPVAVKDTIAVVDGDTTAQCAALLTVIAGPYPSDPDSVAAPSIGEFQADLTGLRIGVVREAHFPAGSDPALGDVFDCAIGVLVACGADVDEVVLPYWQTITATMVSATSEGLAYHNCPGLPGGGSGMSEPLGTIRTLLGAAGLPASAAEMAGLATTYPAFRASIDALYAVPAARYVDRATRFHAAARLAGWDR
ncbi:amidase family protein [Nocardia sp. NBC_01499]|uniref:amidase family protein n=1 Tax=Nocardia sp. NBC_01499 TaxID=2903597 RepID=UPI003869F26A